MQLNLSEYCNREITCSCGSVHFCPINDVKVGSGVLKELPTLLNEYKHILIVADTNTYDVCGREVENLLRGKVCFTHIYHRGGVLIPNEEAVNELLECIPCETDFVLGIGSGVMNDICKFVTREKGLKCGIVATAPSMDGYASSGAAMITNGMKVTYTTHPPIYIIADIDYIKQAPMHMIRSGYGDIIGKYSSLNDWKLSHFVLGEPFCDEIYRLIYDVTESVRHSVNQIINRENEAIENLMNALILIGITLSFLGTTRPGSGGEHHLSHFFEVVGLVRNEPHYPHGTDVAYATIFTAFMRECICAVDKPVFTNETIEERHKNWKRIYGPLYD